MLVLSLLCFTGCGKKAQQDPQNDLKTETEQSAAETADAAMKNSDSDSTKDTETQKHSDKDSDGSKDPDKKNNTDTEKDSSKDKKSSDTSSKTKSSDTDKKNNIKPENVQQFIIDEPDYVTGDEPDWTYENKYENIDPKDQIDISWFDDCVFMGDSLTVGLSLYHDSTGVFGNAKFVCAASLGYGNAQWPLNDPNNVHPYYMNKKILLEDAPTVTGAKKAVVTLGMNDIGMWGTDGSIDYARSFVHKLREKTPDLKIYLETVTPMIYNRQKEILNNDLIRDFNGKLQKLAKDEKCGFLDSYSAFANSNGNLPYYLCCDPNALGLHFTQEACGIWAEFIKTEIGNAYPEEPAPQTDPQTDSESSTETESSETDSENSDTSEILDSENIPDQPTDTEPPREEDDSMVDPAIDSAE